MIHTIQPQIRECAAAKLARYTAATTPAENRCARTSDERRGPGQNRKPHHGRNYTRFRLKDKT